MAFFSSSFINSINAWLGSLLRTSRTSYLHLAYGVRIAGRLEEVTKFDAIENYRKLHHRRPDFTYTGYSQRKSNSRSETHRKK
jgi:hypothetical protein